MQDYKSLCAAVTICATLVNIQTLTHKFNYTFTYTHTHSILISIFTAQPAQPRKTIQYNFMHEHEVDQGGGTNPKGGTAFSEPG